MKSWEIPFYNLIKSGEASDLDFEVADRQAQRMLEGCHYGDEITLKIFLMDNGRICWNVSARYVSEYEREKRRIQEEIMFRPALAC